MSSPPNSPAYAPQETKEQIFDEKTWLQGALLTGVGYGVVVTLFFMCFQLLWQQNRKSTDTSKRMNQYLLVYVCAMFILGTLFMASMAEMTQLSFIENRDYPGGPAAYETDMFWIPVDDIGNVVFTIANWLADSLMLWRCWVIYSGSSFPIWTWLAVPFLLLLASFGMGIVFLIQVSASSPWASDFNFTIPYFSICLALNLTTSLMIAARLLLHRNRIYRALGPAHGAKYAGIASMIVESAALYAVFSLLFLIPFAIESPIANISIQVLSQVQIIAPFLIIFRVAQGKAWSTTTNNDIRTGMETGGMTKNTVSELRFNTLISSGGANDGVAQDSTIELKGRDNVADTV